MSICEMSNRIESVALKHGIDIDEIRAENERKRRCAEDLESAIDGAGRDKVFALARAYGWGQHDAPPEWVWWCLVREAGVTATACVKPPHALFCAQRPAI